MPGVGWLGLWWRREVGKGGIGKVGLERHNGGGGCNSTTFIKGIGYPKNRPYNT